MPPFVFLQKYSFNPTQNKHERVGSDPYLFNRSASTDKQDAELQMVKATNIHIFL